MKQLQRICYTILISMAFLCSIDSLAVEETTHKHHPKHHAATHKKKSENKAKKKVKRKAVTSKPVNVLNKSITEGLNNILSGAARNPNLHVGVIVQSMEDGKILYQYRADQLFTPASVEKLFTAAAALGYLKPSYQFPTQLLTDGAIQNGILVGNLYVKFSGDPRLTLADLNQLFQQLHDRLGVQTIMGHVYIDNYAYDNVGTPPGFVWDDLTHSFAAPMSAIIINRNNFGLDLIPAKKAGNPITIKPNLPSGVAYFVNNVKTVSHLHPGCGIAINTSETRNIYYLKGCLTTNGSKGASLALRDVTTYAHALVHQLLEKNQIRFNTPIYFYATPPNAHVLAAHYSPTLDVIIKKMLKKSDNVATNTVYKKLAETFYHIPGSWPNGAMAVKQLLGGPGKVDFHNSVIIDGAGLSRYNLISPRQLSELLYYAYHNPAIKANFVASLPIAGKDGTLIYRMTDQAREERVRAKTGSMKSVTSLAGYLYTQHNGTLSFVILVNGFSGSKAPYRQLQDRICQFLVAAKRSVHG